MKWKCNLGCFSVLYILFDRGKGDYYRLGHGSDSHVRRPQKIVALRGVRITEIAAGSLHCIALSDRGDVYAWGDNDEGQVGDSTTTAQTKPKLVRHI